MLAATNMWDGNQWHLWLCVCVCVSVL